MLPSGLLQPLELPDKVWEEITMDFIDGLPKSEGYTVIFVVVDRLSKYAHLIPLRHPYTALTMAAVFLKEVVCLHGIPRSIVSDRDKIFLSMFWKELFRMQGTTLKRSTAYHPQTDGQTEVVNRSIETYLRCFTSENPRRWARWVPWMEYWYNTSYHTSSRTTPFKVLYGRDPPNLVHHSKGSTTTFEVERYMEERDQILKDLHEHLLRAQQIMKARADQHRRDVQFQIGEQVYLKLRPYRQQSVVQQQNQKLAPMFYGPFEVIERIGQVAYKLRLPGTSNIHPVFHVSQLKKVIGDQPVEQRLPVSLTMEPETLVQPEQVEAIRKGEGSELEVLIKWVGLPSYEATWEPYEGIQRQFPDFHLEDKVNVLGEGNVTNGTAAAATDPRFGRVYRRKLKDGGTEGSRRTK